MVLRIEPEGTDNSLPLPEAEAGAISTSPKGGRHQHVSPLALVTKNPSQVRIRSDQLTYRILLALLDGKHYTQQPAYGLAEYGQTLPKKRGDVKVAILPRAEESWEHVLASLDLLGDELVDTLLVLFAVALDTHVPEQVESSLVDLLMHEPSEMNQTYQGYEHSPLWHLKIGDWAAMVPELQHQTVAMSRQVLQYHAKEQKHEKRLGRYLTVLYRINAHRHGGRVKVSMGVLLEQARITLDRDNPGRTRDAIESALNQLYTDGVIGSFAFLTAGSARDREAQERIEQHAYHWWDDYLRQLLLFDPPTPHNNGAVF